jgi:hypothetical protein
MHPLLRPFTPADYPAITVIRNTAYREEQTTEEMLRFRDTHRVGLTRFHGHRVMRQRLAPRADAHRPLDCGSPALSAAALDYRTAQCSRTPRCAQLRGCQRR